MVPGTLAALARVGAALGVGGSPAQAVPAGASTVAMATATAAPISFFSILSPKSQRSWMDRFGEGTSAVAVLLVTTRDWKSLEEY